MPYAMCTYEIPIACYTSVYTQGRVQRHSFAHSHLLCPNLLQLLRVVDELRRVCLGDELPLIRFLHKVFIALLVGEVDCILLVAEVEVGALHKVSRGLPAHEWVLPAVTFAQDIPVHAPLVSVPVTGLSGSLCWAENAEIC